MQIETDSNRIQTLSNNECTQKLRIVNENPVMKEKRVQTPPKPPQPLWIIAERTVNLFETVLFVACWAWLQVNWSKEVERIWTELVGHESVVCLAACGSLQVSQQEQFRWFTQAWCCKAGQVCSKLSGWTTRTNTAEGSIKCQQVGFTVVNPVGKQVN